MDEKVEKFEGKNWTLYNGDCVRVLDTLPENSIGFSIFSPPFCSLYSYSDNRADMGNVYSKEDFFEHFNFLIPKLFKVLMPGRCISVHCMNLPTSKERDGIIGIYDFRGDIVRAFTQAGFVYHSEVCIWKDPLIAALRTKAIGLAHKQIIKDSAICRQGLADYLCTFRKPGDNTKPITHKPLGFTEWIGDEDNGPTAKVGKTGKTNKFSHEIWRKYANPVWTDIRQTRVLKVQLGREQKDEKHLCPLQLDVIERALTLWSCEGDIVLSPFAGIGSEGYCAVEMKRKFIGIELKPSYCSVAVRNLQRAENKLTQTDLLSIKEI